jgi:hypothetical protein
MHAYTCIISSGWSYFPLIFSGDISCDCFLAQLVSYLLAGSLAHSPMPFPLHWYSSYYIPSPIPLYWSMTLSSYTLTTSSVGDSVPCYPYHSFSLWLSLPFALTLLLVSDSISLDLHYSCTTAYSLVCAHSLAYINPMYYGVFSNLNLLGSSWLPSP